MIPQYVLHLLSGGMDSTVLLYDLLDSGARVHCLLFDYAQTHIKELGYAKIHCEKTNVQFTVVELHRIHGLFKHTMLTGQEDGSVVVPNRNAIFLNIAAAIAVGSKSDAVSIAVNSDDKEMFPDCRSQFIGQQRFMWKDLGLGIELWAPYLHKTKREIYQRGLELKVDLDNTWTCYRDGQKPCGTCHACKTRHDATI